MSDAATTSAEAQLSAAPAMQQVHPGSGQLMALHVPPSDLKKALDRVDYLGSRGLSGVGALKKYISRHRKRKTTEWFKLCHLHGACMNGCVDSTLPIIYEQMGASLDTTNEHGNTPLHHSVIWGRRRCIVYLLNKGCDTSIKNNDGDTAYEMSIKRQAKLNDPKLQSRKLSVLDREALLVEGLDLIAILEGVDKLGSYHEFAKHNPSHELVGEFSPWSVHMNNRVQLTLLRNLVIGERATQLTEEELQKKRQNQLDAIETLRLQEVAEALAIKNGTESKTPQFPSLEEAMKKDGVFDYMIGLSAMSITTYEGLATVTREMMSRNGNLDAKERRSCWLWIKKQQEECLGGLDEEKKKMEEAERNDPTVNMSKTQKKKYLKAKRDKKEDEAERRIGLNIANHARLPDDAFRFMMGYLY